MRLRSVLITYRMHRFEVLLVTALLALTAISAIVVMTHVNGANPPDRCWIEHWDVAGALTITPGCAGKLEAFWPVQEEATFVASPIAVLLPFVVGLSLGVPVVGRELEMRTAALAWSLSGDRTRWLLTRFLPMLALTLVGLVVAGGLVAEMARAAHPWNYLGPGRLPRLDELGSEGPTLVGRGLMALGIGLLAGAVSGRTLPGFATAAAACFVLLVAGAPVLQSIVADRVAVVLEVNRDPNSDESGAPNLRYVGTSFRDADGHVLDWGQAQRLMEERCPACAADFSGDQWIYDHLTQLVRVAPLETYPTFELTETAASSGIGLLCILLTFPVVSRRRPT